MNSPGIRYYGKQGSGFTLTETLLSSALIAGALLTVVGVFSTSLDISRRSSQTTMASLLARRVIEDLRSQVESTTFSFENDLNPTVIPESSLPQPVTLFSAELYPVSTNSNQGYHTAHQEYLQGFNHPQASHVATWEIKDRKDLASGCKLLQVTIEAPATSPAGYRKVWHYSTLVRLHVELLD